MKFLFLSLLSLALLFGEESEVLLEAEESEALLESETLDITEPEETSSYTDYEELHEYSGYVTLGLLVGTMVTTSFEDTHKAFGAASAIGMATTTTFGVMAHGEDVFDFSDGFGADHWHALLGALATVAIVTTVGIAPDAGHYGLGTAGGILAGVSYGITLVDW
jgi:hypothetical protein